MIITRLIGRNRFRSRLAAVSLIVTLLAFVNFLNHGGLEPKSVWRSLQDKVELQLHYRADGFNQISRDYKLVYVHIPKTGGSTVEESTIFAEKRRLGGSMPRSHHSIRKMMSPTTIEKRGLDEGYLTATHIRHPCERFVSAYYYVTEDPRSKGIKPAVEKFGMMGHGKVENFLDWMDQHPEKWPLLKRRIFHFFPMSSWLLHEDGTFGIDEVLCQEHWEEGIERLFSQLNTTAPHDMHRRQNRNKDHPTCAQLDKKYQAMIMNNYAVDNCMFGYGDVYQDGELTIERGQNASTCVGTNHNRTWFTQRWELCKSKLDPAIVEEMWTP